MKKHEIFFMSLLYVASVGIAFIVTNYINSSEYIIAFVVGAILVSQVAGLISYNRTHSLVPNRIKIQIGIMLSVLFLSIGVVFQSVYAIFEFPSIVLSIGTLGTFLCSFVMINIIPTQLIKHRGKTSDSGG